MKYSSKKYSDTDPSSSEGEIEHPKTNLPEGFELREIPEAIVKFDANRKHTYHSENLLSVVDFPDMQVLGKTLQEAGYLREISEEVDHLVDLVLLSGKQFFKEFSFVIEETDFWITLSLIPEKDDKEETVSVTGVIRNINQQKEIEKKDKERKQRYHLAKEASDNGIWDWVVGSEDMHLSRKWKSLLGYYPDEMEDKFSTWMDKLHPDDYNRVKRTFENFLKSSSLIFETEFRLKHKDGLYRWFKNRAAAVRDADGNAIRIMGTNQDITSEKRSRENYRMLNQAIMQSPVPIVITDLEGYIELFNSAYCKITGYSKDELIGKKTNIQKSGFHPKSFYQKIWETIVAGEEWQGEFKNRDKNGKIYWELATISSLKNEQGAITNYIKISEEITSLKRMAEELKRSKKRSLYDNQNRSNFMANMSHEIRTPINGIIGFSELLKSGNLTQEQQGRYVEIIEESSRSLLLLIDDIIDISKLEANELKLKKDACSLKKTFKELSDQFQQMKEQRGKEQLELRFRKPKLKHHDYIFTDTKRLKQILTNLVDNALKFTATGYVEVGYQLLNNNRIQFYVEDSGIGIPPNYIKSIFNRIAHHAHSLKNKEGGAGLGLSICHGLVNLMGGAINVKSTKGKGSIFYFTIPYDKISSPPKEQQQTAQNNYDFTDFTILIAEDVDYNFEYLKEILRDTHAKILWAKDGIDALNLFSKNKVNAILMDIQLPEIDGYEVTRTIRKTHPDVPIIAQTAYAMADEHQQCLAAGCNEVLTKPIKMKEMLDTLSKYLRG